MFSHSCDARRRRKKGTFLSSSQGDFFIELRQCVRTTLDIEEDVLQAARELAHREGSTIGQVISDLARRGLGGAIEGEPLLIRNGVPELPPRGEVITFERVQQIMDEDAI